MSSQRVAPGDIDGLQQWTSVQSILAPTSYEGPRTRDRPSATEIRPVVVTGPRTELRIHDQATGNQPTHRDHLTLWAPTRPPQLGEATWCELSHLLGAQMSHWLEETVAAGDASSPPWQRYAEALITLLKSTESAPLPPAPSLPDLYEPATEGPEAALGPRRGAPGFWEESDASAPRRRWPFRRRIRPEQ